MKEKIIENGVLLMKALVPFILVYGITALAAWSKGVL